MRCAATPRSVRTARFSFISPIPRFGVTGCWLDQTRPPPEHDAGPRLTPVAHEPRVFARSVGPRSNPGGHPPTGIPPGDYPLVVVGQRPGRSPAELLAAPARHPHATISADSGTRRPCFAAGRSSSRLAELDGSRRARSSVAPSLRNRYDWNSLRPRAGDRAIQASRTGRHLVLPSRPEMEANLAGLPRARTASPFATTGRWESTRARARPRRRTGLSRSRPTASIAVASRSSRSGISPRAIHRRRPQAWSWSLTTPTTRPAETVRRQAHLHHRKQNSRVEPRDGPAPLGRGSIVLASP